ncbi:MAG: SOS response-associated peptidase [Candidatus Kapabacteria bacterium]|nr:SOS response-associated peptidase [Ignavibacteriota bacterium]MCW5883563.1 SOS response-associated peptidase [Candidatus Kapabacteria bacterium]
MCGRFALKATTKDIEKLKPGIIVNSDVLASDNISPMQNISIITNDNSDLLLESANWGFIPKWAKDKSIGSKMFNARAETIDEKPSFRSSFQNRRCLIPASHFYEWQKTDRIKQKIPFKIDVINQSFFFFAGIWDEWKDENSNIIKSATIITTEPNSLMSTIHHRMPVILNINHVDLWLNVTSNSTILKKFLESYSSESMSLTELPPDYFKNKYKANESQELF